MSRRGSLESRAGPTCCTTDTGKHTRTQSLKERFLHRKLPRKIGIDDVTRGGEIPLREAAAGGGGLQVQSHEKNGLLLSSSCQTVGDGERGNLTTTTTTSSTTITRSIKYFDIIFILFLLKTQDFLYKIHGLVCVSY